MYCTKCGSQIPEGSKFCGSCGAMQQVAQQPVEHKTAQYSQVQPEVTSQPVEQGKKKSKGNKIVITCVVVLCAWIIGKIAGGSMADSYNDDNYSNSDYESTLNNASELGNIDDSGDAEVTVANSEYTEIFTSRNIVEAPTFMMGMDSASFAAEVDNHCIQKVEFGYKDDVVLKMVQRMYIPIENYSSIDEIKNLYQEVEQADCCTVEYQDGNLFYTVAITCEDMDDLDNIAALYQLGMVSTATDRVSMKETEAGLIANGYVKR